MPSHQDRVSRNYSKEWWKPWWRRKATLEKFVSILTVALLIAVYGISFYLIIYK